MKDNGFYKITLPIEGNIFSGLSNSIDFIATGKGRLGNNAVLVDDKSVPIVRTTTNYNIPAHEFSKYQYMLIDNINKELKISELNKLIPLSFNNALIEKYDSNYRTMKYHSDQSLDLEKNSFIAIFSCYETPEKLSQTLLRKLKVKNKVTNEEFEIILDHNSVVLFSVNTNSKFVHKIILDNNTIKSSSSLDNRWLGVTLRRSKTYVDFKDNIPFLTNGNLLQLADENQKKEFFKLKGKENNDMNFVYPDLDYTFSTSDLLLPIASR